MVRGNHHRWRGRIAVLMSVIATAGLSGESTDAANKPPKPGSSAVSQYVEMLPTGSGSVAAGTKSGTPAVLQPAARKALRSVGGGAAAALATVATSSAYAAPATTTGPRPKPDRGLPGPLPNPSVAGALSSVAESASVHHGGRVVPLLALVFLTTAVVLAVRVLRPPAASR